MSTTTPNFGWQVPTSTDLVKDGASAIETLGDSIDASLVDLKGGTTGQILSKNTNADMDFVWINNDQGDITAVTAGTGISGGGTSGAVTITNDMATTITASGDIVVGTGSATYDNLPIGTTGQVLTADTTVSPYKVKWATPVAGGLTLITKQTTSNATLTMSDVFTSTYENYLLIFDGYPTTNGNITFKFRTSGGAHSTDYYAQGWSLRNGTFSYPVQITAGTSGTIGYGENGYTSGFVVDIINPAANSETIWASSGFTQSGSGLAATQTNGYNATSSNFTGIQIDTTTTGRWYLYGLPK